MLKPRDFPGGRLRWMTWQSAPLGTELLERAEREVRAGRERGRVGVRQGGREGWRGERDEGKRGRDVYTHLHKFVLVCMRFALCVRITCECSYKLCECIGVWVVRVLECMFFYSGYPSPSFGRSTSEGLCRPSETQQTAESDLYLLYPDLC